MKTIYSEGRVTGLSSYELYVRQVLSRNPDAKILSESQWLAAALGTNNSMILKIEAGTTKGIHNYILPEGSDLCSCTYIIGSVFEGSATFEGDWATRVDDYGRLISNTGQLYPQTPGEPEDVPYKLGYATPSDEFIAQCNEYMKISSGIMLQPGEWVDNVYQVELLDQGGTVLTTENDVELLADLSNDISRMTLNADLSRRGFVRILFDEDVEHEFYVFLHGFSYKNVLAGMSGFDNLLNTNNPENGDFLGPQSFPWAIHITFIYNNDMMGNIRYSVDRMTELYEQVVHSTDYFEDSMRILNNLYAVLTTRYEELTLGFNQVVATVNNMQSTVESLQIQINDINTRIDGVDTSIAATNRRIDDNDTRLNGIDDTLVAINRKVTNVEGHASDIDIRMEVLEESVAEQIETVNATIETVNETIAALDEKVGNLEQLTTTNKTQIVRAINEVNSKIPTT